MRGHEIHFPIRLWKLALRLARRTETMRPGSAESGVLDISTIDGDDLRGSRVASQIESAVEPVRFFILF
jgi:hypothetical protein